MSRTEGLSQEFVYPQYQAGTDSLEIVSRLFPFDLS